jgi:hypothetical protein
LFSYDRLEAKTNSAIIWPPSKLSIHPILDDTGSSRDRCFWRLALAYLRAMDQCDDSRVFKTPTKAAINHGLVLDIILFMRPMDTIGSAYMYRDGAS